VRLNAIALPWCHSSASLFVGSVFVSLLWITGLRKKPNLSAAAVATLLPISFMHAIGHIGAVVSAGIYIYTHIYIDLYISISIYIYIYIGGGDAAPNQLHTRHRSHRRRCLGR